MRIRRIALEGHISAVSTHRGMRLGIKILIAPRIGMSQAIGVFAVVISIDSDNVDFVL